MKTSYKLFLLLLMAICTPAAGQFFVTVEPAFFRVGGMYNLKSDHIGGYLHVWYGDIRGEHEDGSLFFTENIKIGGGVSIPHDDNFTWYAGLNYQRFFHTKEDIRIARLDRIKIISFDIGASLKHNRFTLLFLTDPLNWESMIGVSYRLKRSSCTAYPKHKNHKL